MVGLGAQPPLDAAARRPNKAVAVNAPRIESQFDARPKTLPDRKETIMSKHLTAFVVMLCLAFAGVPGGAHAHGGGLNRDGCHRETATGGYHCHRKNDEPDWEAAAIIIGGLVAGYFVLRWIANRKKGQAFDALPPREERRPRLRFVASSGESPAVGLAWELRF